MENFSTINIGSLEGFLQEVDSYTPDLIFNPGNLSSIYHYTEFLAHTLTVK